MNTTAKVACTALACLALLAGCSTVRKVTYPPDFVYIEQSEIKSSMSRLSVNVWRIDQILGRSETVSPHEREDLIKILTDMKEISNKLGAGTVQSNHPFIDANIDSFKRDVELALQDVTDQPPDYYKAGRLSGRCLACHRHRS